MLRLGVINVLGRTPESTRLISQARSKNIIQKRIPDDVPFPCDVKGWRSSKTPTSVHRLKPGDIDIIASMGDSLSAGTGLFSTTPLDLILENRGATAAGGGQGTWREYLTLPNILKEFNPNLYGYALGDFLTIHEGSKFNVAEPMAESSDMPYMAEILVKRLQRDPKVDMKNHWKHISIMIGSNDFCSEMCYTQTLTELLEAHERDIVKALRIIRDNVPRVFVSLIMPPNLKVLVDSREKTNFYCEFTIDALCPCLFGLRFRHKRPEYYDFMKSWGLLEMKISKYPEFQRDDFTVVAQPILTNLSFPKTADGFSDLTYLAADCFHISQKMNALYATALWNSILLPSSKKNAVKIIEHGKYFLCPTKEHPYLNTYENEGLIKSSNFDAT